MVPHSVTNATTRKSTFCARNALSRESSESRPSRLRNESMRHTNAASDRRSVPAMKARNSHPMVDCANECTEGTGPPRLMNMPICARVNATMIITMFQVRNMPRRF